MRSIMKDDYNINKPKNINIDKTKGKIFNITKLMRFIESNSEDVVGEKQVEESMSYLFGKPVTYTTKLVKLFDVPDLTLKEKDEIVYQILRIGGYVEGKEVSQGDFLNTFRKEKGLEEKEGKTAEEMVKEFRVVIYREYLTYSNGREDIRHITVFLEDNLELKHLGVRYNIRGLRGNFIHFNARWLYVKYKVFYNAEKGKLDLDKIIDKEEEDDTGLFRRGVAIVSRQEITIKVNQAYDNLRTCFLEMLYKVKPKERALWENHVGYKYLIDTIYTHLEYAYAQHINYVQTMRYVKETEGGYATAYMTKKNIGKAVLEEMKKSPLLKYFKYVELDNDTDIERYRLLCHQFEKDIRNLPRIPKVDLRFRKLGRHKANGVYFPVKKCIAIDIRTIDSFIHEYAHAYDFANKILSLEPEFYPIVKGYTEQYNKLSKGNDFYESKRMYYTTPTEIFARAFELYYMKNHTSFLVGNEDKLKRLEYRALKEVEDLVDEYFRGIIK